MKRIGEGEAKVGDILCTGGHQYFYVHNIIDGSLVMSGIDDDGDMYDKNHYIASYIMQTQEERKKFFNLIEKFNLKFDKNRGVYSW